MSNEIKQLKEKIDELLGIKSLQELIADFKHTGKEGIILNQKKEISELTKSVVSLTGKNVKLKEEIKKLKILIEGEKTVHINRKVVGIDEESGELEFAKPDDPNYDKFKELYDKINEESETKERLTKLDDIETKEFLDGEL